MQVSKRSVAREWLIFLLLFCLGVPASFFLGYYHPPFRGYYWVHSSYGSYADFWNHGLGLDSPWSLATWLVPYLAVILIRSIWWSIKTLNISKRALYGTAICVAVIIAAAVTIAIMNAKEKEREAAVSRAESDEAFSAQLLRLDEARAYLLNAADNWRIANRPDQEKRVRQKESDLTQPNADPYSDLIQAAKTSPAVSISAAQAFTPPPLESFQGFKPAAQVRAKPWEAFQNQTPPTSASDFLDAPEPIHTTSMEDAQNQARGNQKVHTNLFADLIPAMSFRGIISAVDDRAKTFTITDKEKSRVFRMTDKTVITNGGNTAAMKDLVINESVNGSYWKQTDGSFVVKSVNIGFAPSTAVPVGESSPSRQNLHERPKKP